MDTIETHAFEAPPAVLALARRIEAVLIDEDMRVAMAALMWLLANSTGEMTREEQAVVWSSPMISVFKVLTIAAGGQHYGQVT